MLLNFTGALFGVRQHGGVGWGEILQLPTPRSSYSSIDLRTSPPPVEGGCRLATTATLVPRKGQAGLKKQATSRRGVKPGGRGNPRGAAYKARGRDRGPACP